MFSVEKIFVKLFRNKLYLIDPVYSNNFLRDELVVSLQREVEQERVVKERLIQEARLRIEQYESRLIQMKQEIDTHKQTSDLLTEELETIRLTAQSSQQDLQSAEEIERKANENEQRFQKMKSIYDNLRQEHINVKIYNKFYFMINMRHFN